jgi:hypothetical protein
VVDARPYPPGDERWIEYQQARGSAGAFLAYLDRYDVNIVLLHVQPGNVPMLQLLGNHPGWRLAHDSMSYGLYVRQK